MVFTVREALKELDSERSDTTRQRPGLRQRGAVRDPPVRAARRDHGHRVSCWDQEDQTSYAFRKKDGIELDELLSITDRFGGIDKAKAEDLGYEVLPGDAWLEQDVDILIPAALENQISEENVDRISKSVKIIAEGANGPTRPRPTPSLESATSSSSRTLLANAGGVTCSYFEQVQSNMNYFWEKDEVLGKLDVKMTSAFIAVSELATREKLYMRDAAYVIAVDRVAQACRDRGWV